MSFTPFGKAIPTSLSELQDELTRVFDRAWQAGISTGPLHGHGWGPVIDVIDEDERFVVVAEVPGLSVADIEVSFEQGELILKGNKIQDRGEEEEVLYVRNERRFGSFCRRVALPEEVDTADIKATCQRGLLEVVLPKVKTDVGTKVKINVIDG